MSQSRITSFAFFLFVASPSSLLVAQDAGSSLNDRVAALDGDDTLTQHVEQLTNRAAALRTEGSFADAAKVDNEIRRACLENDPRLIRANDLKRRASISLLKGEILDAEMYNREADRIIRKLADESSEIELNRDSTKNRANTNQSPSIEISEIERLERQLRELATEVQNLKLQIGIPVERLSILDAVK